MALIQLAVLTVNILGIEHRIFEIAGRIAIALLADKIEQHIVAGAVFKAVGFVQALGRTMIRTRRAASRIVNQTPGFKAILALVGTQHAVPIDQHAEALRKSITVEARIARRGEVPNMPPGALAVA